MRRVAVLLMLVMVTTACSGGGGGPTESADGDGGELSRPAKRAPEPVIPGAKWEKVELGVGEGAVSIEAVAPLGEGFIAVGNDVPSDSVVAWRSTDGVTWERSVIDSAGGAVGLGAQGYVPFNVAARGDTVAVLGGNGSSCRGFICGAVDTVAWVSDDAGVTWRRAEAPPSFAARAAMWPAEVVVTDGGFIAAGHSEGGSKADWSVPVWRSSDGSRWEDVTELTRPEPLVDAALVSNGEQLLVVTAEAFCTEPFLNGNFWVLGAPFVTRDRTWVSDDAGATWQEMAADEFESSDGPPDSVPPVCDAGNFEGMKASNTDVGTLHGVGDTFFAVRERDEGPPAIFASGDLRSWTSAEGAFELGIGVRDLATRIFPLETGFLALTIGEDTLNDGYPVLMWHSADGRSWKPVHEGAALSDPPPFPESGDFSSSFEVSGVAINGDTVVLTADVRTEADQGDAVLWVSRPS